MKLSMSLLEIYLSRSYSLETKINDDTLSITGVRILADSGDTLKKEYVYLDKMADFFQDKKVADNIIIVHHNSRIICRNAAFSDVLNKILGAFEYYTQLEAALNAMSSDKPLNHILEYIGRIIDKDIMVSDMEGNILGTFESSKPFQDQEWINMFHGQSAKTERILENFRFSDGSPFHYLGKDAVMLIPESKQVHLICKNLFMDNEKVAIAFIAEQNEKHWRGDMQIMNVFSRFLLKAECFQNPLSPLQSKYSLLQKILQEGEAAEEQISILRNNPVWEDAVLLVVFRHIVRTDRPVALTLSKILTESGDVVITTVHKESCVALFKEKNFCSIERYLSQRINLQNYYVGVSMVLHDPEEITFAFEQAEFAISKANSAGIIRCKDIALPFLMKCLREVRDSAALLHPALKTLKNYDEKNDTMLYDTLHCYVRNKCNHNITAELMHIHRNTLSRRLDKIVRLTNIAFDDSTEFFYLMLSYGIGEK